MLNQSIKKLNRFSIVFLVAAVLLTGAASAALAQQSAKRTDLPTRDESLYANEPQPLTITQCGQCHPKHHGDLKRAGLKHQFDCRECHEVFHAYNPLKNNYAELMPKCATCHELPHGDKHSECLNCHQNPHTPRQVPASRMLAGFCSDCHSDQAGQLAQYPSRHTEQGCGACHYERHGYIPSCQECHEPHFETQQFTSCTTCHEVHQPLNIALNADVNVQTCNACHDGIYDEWSKTPSKHGQVSCAQCHTEHGMIPQCSNCHTPPKTHAKQMLEKFPDCLTCHLNPHDLPVKK